MNVTAWIATVGLLAGIWQLWALTQQAKELAKQTASNTEAMRASVYMNVSQMMIEIDRIFLERPQLRAEFYGGRDGDVDRQEPQAAAELMMDFIDCLINEEGHMSDGLSVYWKNYFDDLMRHSGALQDFWRKHRDWYGEAVRAEMDRALEKAQS